MNVGQLCSKPALTVPPSAPLSEVASLMRDHQVGAIVVTKAPLDQPVPTGIITDRDIVHAQLDRTADLGRMSAGEVMTRDPLVLNAEEPVAEAIGRMRQRGVRRAPVVDQSGSLVGLVSTDDLIAQVAQEMIDIAHLVTRRSQRLSS